MDMTVPDTTPVPEGDVLPRLGRECVEAWCQGAGVLPETGWTQTLVVAAVVVSAVGWLVVAFVPPTGRRRRDRSDRV